MTASDLNRRQFARDSIRLLAGCGLSSMSVAIPGCVNAAGLPPRPLSIARGEFGFQTRAEFPVEWRTLQRISYGPQGGLFERVCRIGANAFIEEQLAPQNLEEDSWLQNALAGFRSLNLSPDEAGELEQSHLRDQVVTPLFTKLLQLPLRNDRIEAEPGIVAAELQRASILRAAFSRRQLQESMAEFWSDHFNIYQRKGECLWLKTTDDRNIRRHSLGYFRDLLMASVSSPAMLVYLDNVDNRYEQSSTHKLNENYARELLELHTLGIDGGYVLRDIQEVARGLSGWGVKRGLECWPSEFRFEVSEHDNGSKYVLGEFLPSGGGRNDGERIIDILCEHPSTARFIARKLCRRFVGDDQVPELVERMAEVFRTTGGHIGTVLSCLLHSSEFHEPHNRKMKRPFNFVVSALRGLDVSTSGTSELSALGSMGQAPFRWPLPNGYPDTVAAWRDGFLARWNYVLDLVTDQLQESQLDARGLLAATATNDRFAQLQRFAVYLCGEEFPESVTSDIARQLKRIPDDQGDRQLLALVLSSEKFQWRG